MIRACRQAARGDGDQGLPLSTCPHCKGISFEFAHAARHVGEFDHLKEAHAPAG
jgi:hypothetical protein